MQDCRIKIIDKKLLELLNIDSNKEFKNTDELIEFTKDFLEALPTDDIKYINYSPYDNDVVIQANASEVSAIMFNKSTIIIDEKEVNISDVISWTNEKIEAKKYSNTSSIAIPIENKIYLTPNEIDNSAQAWKSFNKTSTNDGEDRVLDSYNEQLLFQKELFNEIRGEEDNYRLVLVKDQDDFYHDNDGLELKETMILVKWNSDLRTKKDMLDNAVKYRDTNKIFTLPVDTEQAFSRVNYDKRVEARNKRLKTKNADKLFKSEAQQLRKIKSTIDSKNFKVFKIKELSQGRLTRTDKKVKDTKEYFDTYYSGESIPNFELDIPNEGLYPGKLTIKIGNEEYNEVPYVVNKLSANEVDFIKKVIFNKSTENLAEKPTINAGAALVLQFLVGYRGRNRIKNRINISFNKKGNSNNTKINYNIEDPSSPGKGKLQSISNKSELETFLSQAKKNIDYTLTSEHSNGSDSMLDVFKKYTEREHVQNNLTEESIEEAIEIFNSFLTSTQYKVIGTSNTVTLSDYILQSGYPYYAPNIKNGSNTFERINQYAYFELDNKFDKDSPIQRTVETNKDSTININNPIHNNSNKDKLDFNSYINKEFKKLNVKVVDNSSNVKIKENESIDAGYYQPADPENNIEEKIVMNISKSSFGDLYKTVLFEEKLHALTVNKLRNILAEESSDPQLKEELLSLLNYVKSLNIDNESVKSIFELDSTNKQIEELLARGVSYPELVKEFKKYNYTEITSIYNKIKDILISIYKSIFKIEDTKIYDALVSYNTYIINNEFKKEDASIISTEKNTNSTKTKIKQNRNSRSRNRRSEVSKRFKTKNNRASSGIKITKNQVKDVSYNDKIVLNRAIDSYFAEYITEEARIFNIDPNGNLLDDDFKILLKEGEFKIESNRVINTVTNEEEDYVGRKVEYNDLPYIDINNLLLGFKDYYEYDAEEQNFELADKLVNNPKILIDWTNNPKSFFSNVIKPLSDTDEEILDFNDILKSGVSWADSNKANNKAIIDRAFLEVKFLIGMLPDLNSSDESTDRNLGIIPRVSLGKAFVEIKEVIQGKNNIEEMFKSLYDSSNKYPYFLDLLYALNIVDGDNNLILDSDGKIDIDYNSPMVMKFWRSFQSPEIEVMVLKKSLDREKLRYNVYKETGVQRETIKNDWNTKFKRNQSNFSYTIDIGGKKVLLKDFYEDFTNINTGETYTRISKVGMGYLTKQLSKSSKKIDWLNVLKVFGIEFTNDDPDLLKKLFKKTIGNSGITFLEEIKKANLVGIEEPLSELGRMTTNLNLLADYEGKYSKLKKTQVVLNSKGDRVASNSLTNTMFTVAELINSNASPFSNPTSQYEIDYNDMLSNLISPTYQHSQTKRKIDKGYKLKIQSFDGFKNITTRNKKYFRPSDYEYLDPQYKKVIDKRVNKNTTALNDSEYMEMLLLFMDQLNTSEIMRTETSSSSWSWVISDGITKKQNWDFSGDNFNNKQSFSEAIFKDYFIGEVKRLRAENKTNYKYKGYNNPSFGIFSFLKPSNDLIAINKGSFSESEISNELHDKILNDVLNTNIDPEILYKKSYIYKGSLKGNSKSVRNLTEDWLDRTDNIFRNKYKELEMSKKVAKSFNKSKLELINRNYIVQQIETSILFAGGVHWYGNSLHKRIKDIASTGTVAPLDKKFYDSFDMELHDMFNSNSSPTKSRLKNKILIVEDHVEKYFQDENDIRGNRILNGAVRSSLNLLNKIGITNYSDKYIEDKLKNLLSKTYGKMEGTDGQSYTSLDFMRVFRNGIGNWSKQEEDLYQWEKLFVKEVYVGNKTPEEFELDNPRPEGSFTQEKWQYRGPVDLNNGTKVNNQMFNKTSFKPLIPSTMYGRVGQELVEKMLKDNISIVSTKSSIKVGLVENKELKGSPVNYFTRDEKDNSFSSDISLNETFEFYTNFLKEQILADNKTKKKSTFGSQLRKLAFPNIKHLGEWVDEDLKTNYDNYRKAIEEISNIERKKLEEELSLESDGNKGYVIKDYNVFINKLSEEADRREMGLATELFLQRNKDSKEELKIPFSATLLRQTLENMLAGIVNKRLVTYKVPGSMLIQTASSGFNVVSLDEAQEYGATGLRYYSHKEDDTRTTTAQVKIAMTDYWKPLLKNKDILELAELESTTLLKALNMLLNNNSNKTALDQKYNTYKYSTWREDNRDLIEIVGYRIPTQGISSIDVFSIEEFLPEVEGNIIVPPFEIVAKSGSDYDIDKMSFFYPNLTREGEFITEELNSELDYKKEIQFNNIVTSIKNSILNPILFSQLVSPVDSGIMEPALKSKNQTTTYSNHENFLPVNNMKKRKDLLDSAKLLGIAAISNTFAQLYNKANTIIKNIDNKDFNSSPVILTNSERLKIYDTERKGWQLGSIFNFTDNGSGDFSLEYKAGVFNEHVNGTVDAAKDPYMGENNYSLDTMSITQYFALLGVPYPRVVNYITQPFIYKRKELLDKGVSSSKVTEETFLQLGINPNKYPKGFFLYDKNNNFKKFDSVAIKNWYLEKNPDFDITKLDGKGRDTLDYNTIDKDEQLFLMADFQDNQIITDNIFKIQELLKFDTAPDKNAFFSKLRSNLREDIEIDGSIIDQKTIDFIIEKSEISSYYIPETIISLFEQIFPKVYSKDFMDLMLNTISNSKAITTNEQKDRFIRSYKNEYLEFLVKQFGTYKDKSFIDYFRGSDSLYKTLPKELNDFLNTEQGEYFKDTILFSEALYLKKNKSGRLVYRIRQDMKEDDLKSSYTETLDKLYRVNKDLAIKLGLMSFVEAGYSKTGYSWQEVLPMVILDEITVPVMTNSEINFDNTISEFNEEFFKAHPEFSQRYGEPLYDSTRYMTKKFLKNKDEDNSNSSEETNSIINKNSQVDNVEINKKTIEVYRTESTAKDLKTPTFSISAHRGDGIYYALDKVFEKISNFKKFKLNITYNPNKVLDLTKYQKDKFDFVPNDIDDYPDYKKYLEIYDKTVEEYRTETNKENSEVIDFNKLLRLNFLKNNIEGVISYIEPGSPTLNTLVEGGREFVDYTKDISRRSNIEEIENEQLEINKETNLSLERDITEKTKDQCNNDEIPF